MIIIGLCGGSGSGKGTVSDVAKKLNIPSIDTDLVYRELTSSSSPCLDELAMEFGVGIIGRSGALDRAVLRAIVFSDAERLARLNAITHKHILSRARALLEEYRAEGKRAAIVDAPLLFESGFDRECDVIVAVVADRECRTERIMARDGITREAAEARIATQIGDDELIARSHYFIPNNGTFDELCRNTTFVLNKILDNKDGN
jgi:dephospho-CoA kinase